MVGTGLLSCPNRTASVLIGAGGSTRGMLKSMPEVGGHSSFPSNSVPGGDSIQSTHDWCAGHMSRSCWRVGCWGRLLESGDKGGSQLLRGERGLRRPGGCFLTFSLHPFFDSLYCFIWDGL